jgi:hypothetical protein
MPTNPATTLAPVASDRLDRVVKNSTTAQPSANIQRAQKNSGRKRALARALRGGRRRMAARRHAGHAARTRAETIFNVPRSFPMT